MGCDTGQGYHISRPITADALTDFLRDRDREAA
jgi:EAL domain-containing protein (putative c-di-GMP-specific phosphodiesterase class I)